MRIHDILAKYPGSDAVISHEDLMTELAERGLDGFKCAATVVALVASGYLVPQGDFYAATDKLLRYATQPENN